MTSDIREQYLLTLRDTLTGKVYEDGRPLPRCVREFFRLFGLRFARRVRDDDREHGRYLPDHAHTMVGTKRLDNYRQCIETALVNGVPGAVVECGVWRGGASIYAAATLATQAEQRELYVCDSFQGLPRPTLAQDTGDPHWSIGDCLGVSEDQVRENFRRYHLLSPNVKFVKGWFSETLHTLQCQQIAVLRADGDMYESTMDILGLYGRVQRGGFVIIDDYGAVPACREAVTDFLRSSGEAVRLQPIDGIGVFWRVP